MACEVLSDKDSLSLREPINDRVLLILIYPTSCLNSIIELIMLKIYLALPL
jgi:hypothetical protein